MNTVTMLRLGLVFLVFVLSGAPASAVLCDLFLCAPNAAAADGCHEHEGSTRGAAAMSAADGCSHLTLTAPFVTVAHRESTRDAVSAGVADGPLPPQPRSQLLKASLVTPCLPIGEVDRRFLPLRI